MTVLVLFLGAVSVANAESVQDCSNSTGSIQLKGGVEKVFIQKFNLSESSGNQVMDFHFSHLNIEENVLSENPAVVSGECSRVTARKRISISKKSPLIDEDGNEYDDYYELPLTPDVQMVDGRLTDVFVCTVKTGSCD